MARSYTPGDVITLPRVTIKEGLTLATALAGALWQYVGPAATFWAGAALATAAAALTVLTPR